MDTSKCLFVDVKFVVAECHDVDNIKTLLIDNGAKHINYLSDDVTIVVSDFNCSESTAAKDLFEKPVVSSLWVHLSLKAKRLLPPEAFSPEKYFFQHTVASFSSELTSYDIKILACALTYHGAKVCKDKTNSTHFIVPGPFCQDLPIDNNHIKIVAPDWVLESVKHNCCCDEKLFEPNLLLPSPQPQLQPPTPQPASPIEEQTKEITASIKADTSTGSPEKRLDTPNNLEQQPSVTTQQHQQNPPLVQSNRLQWPRLPINSIRGAQPRFRPILPPNSDKIPPAYQPVGQSGTDQSHNQLPNRVSIGYGQIRKVVPYQNQNEMQQTQQQTMNQRQAAPYSQEQPHVIIHQPTANRLPQQGAYHQVQGTYQNDQVAIRDSSSQPMIVRHQAQLQQQQTTVVNRFQDPNSQTSPQRPYQIQQHQNQQYQHTNIHRQPGYYTMGPNQMALRVSQPNPSIRQVQPEQVMYDNLSNTNQVRPEFATNQPHYQTQSRAQNLYATTPQQIRAPQHQHLSLTNQTQPVQAPTHIQPVTHPHQSVQTNQNHQLHPHPQAQQHLPQSQQQPTQVVNMNSHQITLVQSHQPPQIQSQTLSHNQIHAQTSALTHSQLRSQYQPTSGVNQVIRAQQRPPNPTIDHKLQNIRPVNLPQPINQNNGPKIVHDDNNQPQPYPSIFDHTKESNLSLIKTRVPIVDDSVTYFGHDPRQIVPKNKPLIGCKFKIVEYQDVDPSRLSRWIESVEDSGGIRCNNLAECTHLICETRKSDDFAQAMKLKVRCVTFYWVYDVMKKDYLKHPWKALHLPLPYTNDEKPLRDQVISLTNFQGSEKSEAEEMVRKTGASLTKYFSPKNTLLICRKAAGDKYERAIEWRIPIANCQILTDVLLHGRNDITKLLSQAKYASAMSRGDPFRISSYSDIRDLLISWTKPLPLFEPVANSSVNGVLSDNSAANTDVTEFSGAVNIDDRIVNGSDSGIGNKIFSPEDEKSGAENQVVIDNLPDSPKDLDSDTKFGEPKQPKNTQSIDEKLEDDVRSLVPVKQLRKSQDPIRILLTNIEREQTRSLTEAAKKLGIGFATSPTNCTHLIVGRLCRTVKFICAFSHAKYILRPEWLIESSATGSVLDEKQFTVDDSEGEERLSFNLVHSMLKRKRRSDLLFHDWILFITPSVKDEVPGIVDIIESAGGGVATRKLPTKKQLDQLRSEGKKFVVVTNEEDYNLCVSSELSSIEFVSPEFVICGILRQDIDFDSHRVRKKAKLE